MQLRHLERLALDEDMRMAPDQLVANPACHRGEVEAAGLLGHAGMKHHLEQQVTELIAQSIEITAPDRVGDLVRLFDRERRDAGKTLLPIPRTAALRIAKGAHQAQQCLEFIAGGAQVASPTNSSRRFASIPAVAPQILYGPKDSSQLSTSTPRIVRRPTR